MLLTLPYELLHAVCMLLPITALLRLASTCRAVQVSIATDAQLWRALSARDMGHNIANCPPALLFISSRLVPNSPMTHYRLLNEVHVTRTYRASRRSLRVVEWQGSVDAMVRVCALGPRHAGKTSLLHLLSTGHFSKEYLATDSIDSYTLFTSANNRRAIVRLLDTPGELPQCLPLLGSLFDECDVVLLFAPDSPNWLHFIRSHTDAPIITLTHATTSYIPPSSPSIESHEAGMQHLTLVASPNKRREAVITALMSFVPPPPSSLRAVPSHHINGPYQHYNYQLDRQRSEDAEAHPHFAVHDLDEDE